MNVVSDDELVTLRIRAQRALGGLVRQELVELSRRAIVGPPPEQMTDDALAALEKLQRNQSPTATEVAALEYAIRLFRPAPFVRDQTVDPLPEESAPTFPAWSDFSAKVRPYLRSIGRVDRVVRDVPSVGLGTGFLIAPTLLVTNRHVVWQLSHGGDVVRPGEAVVYFRYDWETPPEPPIKVLRVAAFDSTLDLAILELEMRDDARVPLHMSTTSLAHGRPVVTVGFPWDDGRNPAFVPLLFGDQFGVKRAAPGEIVGRRVTSFLHDCTTLSGNSGSPVLTIDTAEVVGIHADGLYLYRNEAIAAPAGAEFLGPYAA